jgi:hypothetical protein
MEPQSQTQTQTSEVATHIDAFTHTQGLLIQTLKQLQSRENQLKVVLDTLKKETEAHIAEVAQLNYHIGQIHKPSSECSICMSKDPTAPTFNCKQCNHHQCSSCWVSCSFKCPVCRLQQSASDQSIHSE